MIDLTGQLPSSLKAKARWERIGEIPVMLVHPEADEAVPAPTVIWLHGRTATKELDPGRYLRWMRSGIAACAVDLPGHGERLDETLQQPSRTLDVVMQMADELDGIVDALGAMGGFDLERLAIGGMSAGGMATMLRLYRSHPFVCASVEATSGSWKHQRDRAMFSALDSAHVEALDPIEHIETWREIPFQAIHARHDQWMHLDGQSAFISALRKQYADPEKVEFVVYEQTGAPYEHVGFGSKAADAKNRQLAFIKRHLLS